MGVSKSLELGLSWFWGPISLCADLQLRWGLKQSFSHCHELSNNMLHATYTQGNRVDYRLLVGGNQTTNLTPKLSFGHNLCFRCSNGSCEPILDIYVQEIFNDIRNTSIQWVLAPAIVFWRFKSPFGTPTPTMGVHLGVWRLTPSHPFALPRARDVTLGLASWPATL
jgi:hypothetical protein